MSMGLRYDDIVFECFFEETLQVPNWRHLKHQHIMMAFSYLSKCSPKIKILMRENVCVLFCSYHVIPKPVIYTPERDVDADTWPSHQLKAYTYF